MHLHDTRTPVFVGIGAMVLNILLSLVFSQVFISWGWLPHGGLALANSLATTLESIILLILMRKRLAGLEGSMIWKGVLQAMLASGVMAAVIWGWGQLFTQSSVYLYLFGALGLGLLVFAISVWLMRVPEVISMLTILKKRLTAKKHLMNN